EESRLGDASAARGVRPGFVARVDGAAASGYRAPRAADVTRGTAGAGDKPGTAGVAILAGEYGAAVIEPLLERLGRPEVRVIAVRNEFFGGNIAVAGLVAGADVARELAAEPGRGVDVSYPLPDVCLSPRRCLDGLAP